MRTVDFIKKEANKIESCEIKAGSVTGLKRCSSVYSEGGRIYSYGYHYPLLFRVTTPHGSEWVVNNSGYSVTTSKHIGYAHRITDIGAPVQNIGLTEEHAYKEVLRVLNEKRDELIKTMDSKKRKDTQVYKWLEYDLHETESFIKRLSK